MDSFYVLKMDLNSGYAIEKIIWILHRKINLDPGYVLEKFIWILVMA